jgi:hypothetical protein
LPVSAVSHNQKKRERGKNKQANLFEIKAMEKGNEVQKIEDL